jgi:hypothetical protein
LPEGLAIIVFLYIKKMKQRFCPPTGGGIGEQLDHDSSFIK